MSTITGRIAVAALLGVLLAASPSVSWAQIPLDVGVTVKGGVNVSGISKPGQKEYDGHSWDIPYPGFVGVGGQVGIFFEPREIADGIAVQVWRYEPGMQVKEKTVDPCLCGSA